MKTVRLFSEDFTEVHAAMTAAMDGREVLFDVLAARFGPDSDPVVAEHALGQDGGGRPR